jgi:hypothetical protein
MATKPIVLGLSICDYVIVEEKTKKVSLVGSFSGLGVDDFPARALPFSVYAALCDAVGPVTFTLVVTRLDTGEEIYKRENHIVFPDKLTEVHYVFRLYNCEFPVASWYQFTLLGDGEWLAQRRVRVYVKGAKS